MIITVLKPCFFIYFLFFFSPLIHIQVMIYLIDKVLPDSYFANNLRALSGKQPMTVHLRFYWLP